MPPASSSKRLNSDIRSRRHLFGRFLGILGCASAFLADAARAEAPRGFGSHPLAGVFDGGGVFGLMGLGVNAESHHLKVVPASLGLSSGLKLTESPAFGLYERGLISAEEVLTRLVREQVGALLGIRSQADDNGSYLMTFHAGGVKLCFFGVRGAPLGSREIVALGQVPQVTDWSLPTGLSDWPEIEGVSAQAVDTLERSMGGPVQFESAKERCFATEHGSLKPAWRLAMSVRGYQYAVYADGDQVFTVEPEFFHASGKASVYPYDAVTTPTLVTETLTDLTGDGTLSNANFRTAVSASSVQVSSPSGNYIFGTDTPEFEETSLFVNVNKHYKFLQTLGFNWYGPRPLVVQVKRTGMANNARFLPSSSSGSLPTIEIGKGDGRVLRNLGTDAAVVSHELGHFAIYRAVTKTSGESFVLHEALADYFEAARAEDPCLGNSVCTTDGIACVVVGQCLRTAENEVRYQDQNWQGWLSSSGQYSHLHGQVFSGLLWGLREEAQKAQGGVKGFDTLVMRAIGFLPPEAGFEDLLTQLMVTDKEMTQGSHRERIRKAVLARDLGEFLKVDESGDPLPSVNKTGATVEPNAGSGAADSSRTKQKTNVCGVVKSPVLEKDGTGADAAFLLLLGPVLLIFMRNFIKYVKIN